MFGYVEKTGYFEDEKKASYQGKLPDWALLYKGTIRRFGGKVRSDDKLDPDELRERQKKRREKKVKGFIVDVETNKIIRKVKERPERQERSYELRIKGCGSKSMVEVVTPDYQGSEILDIPFTEWRNYQNKYDKDLKATIVYLTSRQLNKLRKKYNIKNSVLDALDFKEVGT